MSPVDISITVLLVALVIWVMYLFKANEKLATRLGTQREITESLRGKWFKSDNMVDALSEEVRYLKRILERHRAMAKKTKKKAKTAKKAKKKKVARKAKKKAKTAKKKTTARRLL